MRPTWRLTAIAACVIIAVAGCSSSKPSSSTGAGYTLGVLADLSGPGSNTNSTTPKGIQAGTGVAAKEGYKIKYVVADTASSPSGALTGAQKLVEQDHVFAVIAVSGLTFAAANYLSAQHVPVVGAAIDSTEWITSRNMFSVIGAPDFNSVETTTGLFFKKVGVTTLGALGYGSVPSAAEAAKGAAVAAQSEGIKVGYLNADFPLFSTDVGPEAIAMRNARVDGLTTSVETNVSFALVTALRQQGANLRAALLPTGYGGDLVAGGPGAVQAAQGIYFISGFEPVEMRTAATQRFQAALVTYAGVTGEPTFAEYLGYVSLDAFVTGLKAAGAHPTQASFINAMLGITSYNAVGLYGAHSIGFTMNQRGHAAGADNCFWVTQFSGSSFHLVAGADPICGSILPGKKVSPSS
jgi:branched-chain amino acid transport system substrate-binding protein